MSKRAEPSKIDTGSSRVLPVPGKRISLKKPVLLAGFPDSGMVGSITINYLIESLEMHQIAFVESQFIMPAALFIGKRFRHPFRIYSTANGKICTLICELPIASLGTYPIINAITNWCKEVEINDTVVLGGIPPGNFSPSVSDERRALLLYAGGSADEEARAADIDIPATALVTGLAGALLSTCAARDLPCKALMVPAFLEVPDPEGAAILLESVSRMVPDVKVDTTPLRKQADMIRKQMEELLKMHRNSMKEYEKAGTAPSENMYK